MPGPLLQLGATVVCLGFRPGRTPVRARSARHTCRGQPRRDDRLALYDRRDCPFPPVLGGPCLTAVCS